MTSRFRFAPESSTAVDEGQQSSLSSLAGLWLLELVLDANGLILVASDGLCELLGRPRADVVGRPLGDFLAPEGVEGGAEDGREARPRPSPGSVDLSLVSAPGRVITLRGQVTPCLLPEGTDGHHCCFVDVTAEHERIRELVAAERRKTALSEAKAHALGRQGRAMDAALHGLAILVNQRYVYMNAAYARLYGYAEPAQLIGCTWRMLHAPDEGQRLDEVAFGRLDAIGQWHGEATGLRRDGTNLAVSLLISKSTKHEIVCACSDLTEQKALERELREQRDSLRTLNEALKRAARAKDEFMASMSHELRTPLSAILGMAQILDEEILGALTTDQNRSVQTILESGRHLLALINDILDLARCEAEKLDLESTSFELRTLTESTLRLVQETATRKGLRIALVADLATGLLLRGDERRVRQMLINLLDNAIKFTAQGGHIGVEIVPASDHSFVEVCVWDTGIGIKAEDLPRLFQPFVQLNTGHARQYQGTGLGLSLVRRLAELHRGTVTVESTVNQGSRFTLRLPWDGCGVAPVDDVEEASAPTPYPQEAAARTGSAARAPRILVADDNAANLAVTTSYLRAHGVQVDVAGNGFEVLAREREAKYDVILLDVDMPGMGGLDAVRYIRDGGRNARTPIIALTALAMPGDRERCLAAGMDDYLSKPVRLRALVERLERLLDRPVPRTVLAERDSSMHGRAAATEYGGRP